MFWDVGSISQFALLLAITAQPLQTDAGLRDTQSLYFTKEPTDVTFLNTKSAKVECKANGSPKATISWQTVDGKAAKNISGIRHILLDGSLEFPTFAQGDFRPDVHATQYRCLAQNKIGKLQSRLIRVKAVIDSPYSPTVFHQMSFVGGSAVFKCHFEAASHISLVSWSLRWQTSNTETNVRDGESNGRFHVLKGLPYIIISRIRNADNFLAVKCFIKDSLSGVTLKSSSAYVYIQNQASKKASLVLPPVSQNVLKGTDAVLPCVANGGSSLVYTWYKNGARLAISPRVVNIVSGSMVLKHVSNGDAGEYKCIVRSPNQTLSASMNLSITEGIRFTRTLQSQFIPLGNTLRFSCKVTGLPTPSITWIKDGTPLSTGSRMVIDRSIQTNNVLSSDLLLYLVSHRDEGVYQCVSKNAVEERQTSARLVVGAIKPRITTLPQTRQVLEQDQTLSLKCIAAGQPTPQFTWWSDGVQVFNSQQRVTIATSNTASGGVQSILMIQGLRMSDSAVYACKSENKAGVATATSDVTVKGAPTIVRFPERVYALVNQPVYLHCIAKGYPLATFKWSKDSWHNLATDDLYKIFENGTLFISSVQEKSKGQYKCQASNEVGDDEKTLGLYVQVPPTIAPFKWTPIEAGHRTSKTCQVPTGDLPIKITWYWNGKIIISGNGVTVDTKDFLSYLTFSEVKAAHRGRYTCKAENAAGSASYSEELLVHESPKLTLAPNDVSILKPNTLHLICKGSGFPSPQIVWYKKGEFSEARKLLHLTDRVRQYQNGSLLIYRTSAKDNGKYTCSAENDIGKNAERTITVDIKVPAKVIPARSKVVKQRKDASAVIRCEASGTPDIKLHWYKSSKPISVSSKFNENKLMRRVGNQVYVNSTLKINTLQRADNGTYICQVTNSFGGDTQDFRVVVLERPDPPKIPLSEKISSRWLEVTWSKPYNGHSAILRYTVEYKRHSDMWSKVARVFVPGNNTKATVHGLSPGVNYNFRIRATNGIGESQPSEDSVFRTREEAPSSSPTNVTVTAIAKDKLKVQWRAPRVNQRNGILLGYYVTYKEFFASTPDTDILVQGQQRHEALLEDLLPYTSYEITVKAFTKAGVGPPSPVERRTTLQGAPTAPPTSIKATAISSQIIRVTWGLPPFPHRHGLIKGYKVKYFKKLSKKVLEKTVTRVHYAELTNLEKYTEYEIFVLAFTEGGDGKTSKSIISRTLEDVPGPPEQLRAAAASPHQIMVTWKKPSKPNGVITGYILHYRKSMDGSTSQHEVRLSRNASSSILHGLEVGKKYEIWMNAQTVIGTGLRTGFVKAMTMTKIPARILTLTQIVKVPVNANVGLPCVAVGHPKPVISWYFNIKRIIKRRRRRSTPYYNEGKLVLSDVKLKDAGAYNCSAVNQYGSDWNIITLVVQGFPARPRAIKAEQFNKTSINISWVPGFNGHSPFVRHEIKYRYGNLSSWNYLQVPSDKLWMTFDMKVGSKAFFAVASENSVGVGPFSNTIEVHVTANGLVTRVVSEEKRTILESVAVAEEKENVIGPIIAGCVVAVVIVTIIMLLASWDRTERRMRTPKCNRLFVCECDDDFPKDQFRGTYDGPYNEPNMPWPWNSAVESVVSSNDEPPTSNPTGEEERFPEHLFAQLLNFDETEEDEDKATDTQENSSPDKPESAMRFGTPSTNTYKTSESSQLSKGIYTSNSLLSSRNMPSSNESDSGNAEATGNFISRSVEGALSEEKYTERAKRSYKDQQLRHYFKSLDSGLQKQPNLKLYLTANNGKRNKTGQPPKDSQATGMKSLTLIVRDNKVKRSRSVRSYDSVSSTCSSTRGELVRAYEFGRKYRLQEYIVPQIGDSTTEDSCSEISELCEFSSLPRNTNDCLLRMPLPIRPDVVDATFKGLTVKNFQDPYDGESLV
ncbi:cell adhesion molecule DSCAM-like [Rhopilema esculentum]|uniref:cell adhesion molecule DSCAM-like n=1 Tax=Rhopilema esculentum TaxID=499914 RepID=UPI0031DDAF51